MPALRLEPRGSDFVLRRADARGKDHSLLLSEDDILTLAQSLPGLRDQILSKRSQPGVGAVLMTPVAQIALNTDLHQSEIHLTMIDRHGARLSFALPLEVARPLADRLPVRIREIETAVKGATRQ